MAANSGIEWIDVSFDKAVEILYWVANLTGVSYEEINVLIFGLFAIAWPISMFILALQSFRIIKLKRLVQQKPYV